MVNNPHITDVGEQNTDINRNADVGIVGAADTPTVGEATPLITRGQVTPTSTPIHGRDQANYKQPEGLLLVNRRKLVYYWKCTKLSINLK